MKRHIHIPPTKFHMGFIDFPTAWLIQHQEGDKLEHHPNCSSVPGWHPLSGPGFLCDCGAIERRWQERRQIVANPAWEPDG